MKRVTVVLAVLAGLAVVACGPEPLDETKLCGPSGCDGCIGANCAQRPDGGAR
ncbi:MAG: hypothetical protein ACOZQL_33925 [Myxococcota bacterium]